jgi:hypothetical protein
MGIPRGVIQVHEVTLVVIHTFPPYMTATDGILVDCVLLPPHISRQAFNHQSVFFQ